MPKTAQYELVVASTKQLTANMKRITLRGSDLERFPHNQEGAYIKLYLPQENEASTAIRTYTVSSFRPKANELDIDFVLHEHGGPASIWAQSAELGEKMTIGGPGPKKLIDLAADWFFIVGDMTALPAIMANLNVLPKTAKGYVVLEVVEVADIQNIRVPSAVELHWVVSASDSLAKNSLVNKVESLAWLEGIPYVWTACEFSSMRALRKYFKVERHVEKDRIYISSYWKKGVDEGAHKIAKRDDSQH